MRHTLRLHVTVPESHRLEIDLPREVPAGPADIEMHIELEEKDRPRLSNAMRDAGLIGLWADRKDLDDSPAFARKLRREGWSR